MSDIFPLRLTPMELCWYFQDQAAFPLQFFLRVRINGDFAPRALDDALAHTLLRHPLLGAVVRRSGKRWEWHAADNPPQIQWIDGTLNRQPECRRRSVREAGGLQATVIRAENASDLWLCFQHTACDGLAAMEFTGDLLASYVAMLSPEAAVPQRRVDPRLLSRREHHGWTRWQHGKWIARNLLRWRRLKHFGNRHPMKLDFRSTEGTNSSPHNILNCLFHRFTDAESLRIQTQARAGCSTLNSLVLASLFQAVAKWQDQCPRAIDGDVIRVSVPVSLRSATHRAMPACNQVSIVYLDHRLAETNAGSELQHSIHAEMEQIKREGRDRALPELLRLVRLAPQRFAKLVHDKRFDGNVMLTHLGPALAGCLLPRESGKFCLGDLRVEQIDFVPAVRPGQWATVAISMYAGRIALSMSFNKRYFSESEAKNFLNSLVELILHWPATVSSRSDSGHDAGLQLSRSD